MASKCYIKPVNLGGDRNLKCDKGIMSEIIYKGINRYNSEELKDVGSQLTTDYCGNPEAYDELRECQEYLDTINMDKDFNSLCHGSKSCDFNLSKYYRTPLSSSKCYSHFTKVYIQFKCLMTEDEMEKQQMIAYVVIGLCSCSAIMYLMFI